MSTTRWERVMTQEQLMKVKIKYLEDRITTMEKSIERLHKIVGTRDRYKHDQGQGFKDIDINESVGGGFSLDDDHELI